MIGDFGLLIQSDNSIDLRVDKNDLAVDAGLQTAVIISLFTDRRIDADDLPDGETSMKGWWADQFPDVEGDLMGSRLWLLKRAKRTDDVLRSAEEYAVEALSWMIEDGLAASVDAQAAYDDSGAMVISLSIQEPGDSDATTFRFKLKWGVEDRS